MLAWIASITVLVAYALSVKLAKPRIFHWANVPGSAVLAFTAFSAGVPANAFLSTAFGVLGVMGLMKKGGS